MSLNDYLKYVGFAILAVLLFVAVYNLLLYLFLHSGFYYKQQDEWLKREFSRCNTIVFGKKGTGKDLLFAHAIWLRNEVHYANMPYDEKTIVIKLKELRLCSDNENVNLNDCSNLEKQAMSNSKGFEPNSENSFVDIVNGTVTKVDPTFQSGCDVYISDGGIYLGCQYNAELNKLFPSLPVRFALSRQLDQNNIHINVQYLGRIWDKLREQADSYIWIRSNTEYKNYFLVDTICYEKYQSAADNVLPQNSRTFIAKHGDCVARVFKIYKKELTYDTHYFRRVFYNEINVESDLERSIKNV